MALGAKYLVLNEARFRRGEGRPVNQLQRRTTGEAPNVKHVRGWNLPNKTLEGQKSELVMEPEGKNDKRNKETLCCQQLLEKKKRFG